MENDKTSRQSAVASQSSVDSQSSVASQSSADADEHIGAVEGDRPTDSPNQGNPHGSGVDSEGMPNDPVATCEDVIGANVDGTEGG